MILVVNPSPESVGWFLREKASLKSEARRQYEKTLTVIIFPVVARKRQ